MAYPRAVRYVARRSIGSRTRPLDGTSLPAPVYYGAGAVKWSVRHWPITGPVAVAGLIWGRFGSLLVGMLLGVACGCLMEVLRFRSGRRVASPLTLADYIAEKRQRYTLKRQWPLACQQVPGLIRPGKGTAPGLRRVKATDAGTLEATVCAADDGVAVSAFQKHAAVLAEMVKCRDVTVIPGAPGVCRLQFHWSDLIGRTLRLSEMPPGPTGHVTFGRTANGAPASFKMNLSVLLGGLTERGKSNIVHAGIADLLRQGVPLRLYISDPKSGMELREYGLHVGEKNGNFEVRGYAKTAADSEAMIKRAAGAMMKRAAVYEERGLRTWVPTPEDPLVVVVVDELPELEETLKDAGKSHLAKIVRLGRAVGYTAWIGSQAGQLDVTSRLRSFIPQRVCLATADAATTDAFLGNGATARGATCHEIGLKGEGFALSDSDQHPTRFRAALVPDDEVRVIAAGHLPAGVSTTAEMRAAGGVRTALYRWFKGDELLYVGITWNLGARTDDHADKKPWMEEATRSTVEHFPTRALALEAEKHAIQTEHPKYNTQHNGPWSPSAQFRAATRRPTA